MLRALVVLVVTVISFEVAIPIAFAREVAPLERKPVDSDTEWIGVAASPDGRIFEAAHQGDEVKARDVAKVECEQTSGQRCNVIAVPSWWDVIVVYCKGSPTQPSNTFVGGSALRKALDVTFIKVQMAGFDPSNCFKIYSY